MTKKGFTLIEAIIGISLIGLIAVTVLPIINSSHKRIRLQKNKAEMIYIGESIIEKIKAYEFEKSMDILISDVNLTEIITLFKEMENVEITLHQNVNNSDYEIKIRKENNYNRLWTISVNVSEKGEGENNRQITYEALVPEK